jgi:hypothetical protein
MIGLRVAPVVMSHHREDRTARTAVRRSTERPTCSSAAGSEPLALGEPRRRDMTEATKPHCRPAGSRCRVCHCCCRYAVGHGLRLLSGGRSRRSGESWFTSERLTEASSRSRMERLRRASTRRTPQRTSFSDRSARVKSCGSPPRSAVRASGEGIMRGCRPRNFVATS